MDLATICRGNDGKWHWYIFPNAMGREAWKTRPHVRGEYRVSSWKLVDKDRYIFIRVMKNPCTKYHGHPSMVYLLYIQVYGVN